MTRPRQIDDCIGPDGEVDLAALAWALHLEPSQLAGLAGKPVAIRSAYLLACRIRPWLSSNAETGRWLTETPFASQGGMTPIDILAAGRGNKLMDDVGTLVPEMQAFAPVTVALADTRESY